jgi:hypothetical protein
MLIDFGQGLRELFTATVNQKVTYGLATIHQEPRFSSGMGKFVTYLRSDPTTL